MHFQSVEGERNYLSPSVIFIPTRSIESYFHLSGWSKMMLVIEILSKNFWDYWFQFRIRSWIPFQSDQIVEAIIQDDGLRLGNFFQTNFH